MARKKQEIALQVEIESQEGWEELLQKEGLIVIDVYQEWCGPCRAMTSFFRRIKNETGDDFLHFAIAKTDNIDSLERYRGKSEPCFLFYGGGVLVAVVRGANPPVIDRTIRQKLDEEHRVLRGEAERQETRDPAFAHIQDEEKGAADEREAEETEVEREVTFALIKPDAVSEGRAEEILAKLGEAGIEVLYTEERQLTDDEARSFYSHLAEEEFYESYIEFMCSGNSMLLALAKGDEGVIDQFRELLGPKSVEEAKEAAPDSLRAQFGSESFKNAIHGADSKDSASRELAFFFPNFVVPRVAKKKEQQAQEEASVQRTLALIRPDAYAEYKDSIIAKIRESGFRIAMQKEIQLNKEQAEEFYKEHKDEEYFDELTNRMCSGPLVALALARQDAIAGWRTMLGPTDVKTAKEVAPESLRAQFSREDVPINLLHGSSSDEQAEEELRFFFPMEQTVVAVKPDAYENRDEIMDKIKEAGFHIAARKETQLTPEMAREFYKDQEEKEYYGDLVDHMCSGETLFLVLSREDAVQGWRSLMGTTDPEMAAEEAPDSLRAVYGKDVKENALHGSSNPDQVNRSIQLIFGDVAFDAGTEAEGEEGADTHRSEAEPAETGPEGEEAPVAAEGEGEEAALTAVAEGEEEGAPAAAAEGGEAAEETPAAGEDAPPAEDTAAAGEAEERPAAGEGEEESAPAGEPDEEAEAAPAEAAETAEAEAAPAEAAETAEAEAAPETAAEPEAPASEEAAGEPPAEAAGEAAAEEPSGEAATEEAQAEEAAPAAAEPEAAAEEAPAASGGEDAGGEAPAAEEKPAEAPAAEEKPVEAPAAEEPKAEAPAAAESAAEAPAQEPVAKECPPEPAADAHSSVHSSKSSLDKADKSSVKSHSSGKSHSSDSSAGEKAEGEAKEEKKEEESAPDAAEKAE